MKVEELMIGDIICAIYEECDDEWNEITHNIPSRITGVSLYHDLGDCMRWECDPISDENKKLYDRFDSFEPIPLTDEILEKNGFKIGYGEHHGNEGLIDDVNKHYYVKVCRSSDGKDEHGHYEDWSAHIDQHSPIHVHELQRMLRCCGLWDIAEKFKV